MFNMPKLMQGRENSSSTLQGLPTGLRIKFTRGRVTGEKAEVSSCVPNNEVETQRNDENRQFLYFLNKETVNL